MARAAAEDGTKIVVCTPHLKDYHPEEVARTREVAAQVRKALAEAGVTLGLIVGFEVDLAVAAECAEEELTELAIGGSKHAIILEMPYQGWPRFLDQTLFRLRTRGFRPVLAHPERNDRVQKEPGLLESCTKAGAVIQSTVASLTGEFGKKPERTFQKMLGAGLVGLLASDAHAYRTDGWTLGPTVAQLRGSVGDEIVTMLVEENPRRLLAGEPLR